MNSDNDLEQALQENLLPLALAVGLYLMLPRAEGFGILGLIPIYMAVLAVYGLGRSFRYVLPGD
jgi:hypothetical protein